MQQVTHSTACSCNELVLDNNIYPRCRVSEAYIAELAEALQAGATLPPILVDKNTKKIIDGAHRFLAYKLVFGEAAFVPVEWVECQNEAELVRLAIQTNAKHGMRLERMDQRRCVHLLSQYQYTVEDIAAILALPLQRVELLRTQVAIAPRRAPQVIPGTAFVPLKRSVIHLAGQQLSSKQLAGLQSAPGTSYRLLIHQLTDGIRKDLLPQTPQLLNALADLALAALQVLRIHREQLSEEYRQQLDSVLQEQIVV